MGIANCAEVVHDPDLVEMAVCANSEQIKPEQVDSDDAREDDGQVFHERLSGVVDRAFMIRPAPWTEKPGA